MDTAIFTLFPDWGPSRQYQATAFVFVFLSFISLLERTLISPERHSLLCLLSHLSDGGALPPHLFLILYPSFRREEGAAVPPPCQKPLFRPPSGAEMRPAGGC